jgi:hypothetical protein
MMSFSTRTPIVIVVLLGHCRRAHAHIRKTLIRAHVDDVKSIMTEDYFCEGSLYCSMTPPPKKSKRSAEARKFFFYYTTLDIQHDVYYHILIIYLISSHLTALPFFLFDP